MILELQATMADDVGPFRTEAKLKRALATMDGMTRALGERPIGDGGAFDLRRLEWLDLRNMLLVARTVAKAALARAESRGAHQREDFPGMLSEWRVNQQVRLVNNDIVLSAEPATAQAARADEPPSGECPARALQEPPRWPLASLASAAKQ
jgi:succinate dehydrogenase/fumarate reductase flavoprotein subunit